MLALRLGGHDGIGDIGRDGLDGVADAENLADFFIDQSLCESAGGDGVDDGLAKVIGAGHLDIEAVEHCAHRAVGAAPVADGEALEAPLAAEDFVQEVLVF